MSRLALLVSLLFVAACDCNAEPKAPCDPCADGEVDADVVDAGSDAGPDVDVPGCDGACPPPPCPPRACNTVARDADGVCVYLAAYEGASCEDGDACTADDRCAVGACTGEATLQTPSLRGVVTSYGAEPTTQWLEGIASFVADDRLIFLESTKRTQSHISLVEVTATGLTRLDETESNVGFAWDTRSVVYWGDEQNTYVLPVGDARFAVLSSNPDMEAGIEVFDIEDDALVRRGLTPLPRRNEAEEFLFVHGAASREGVIFVCGNTSVNRRLRAYVLDDTSTLFTKTAELSLPQGGCNELALSPEGDTLHVAGNGGYRVYDVTDPATFAVPTTGATVLVPDHFVEDIEVSGEHIVLGTAKVAGELSEVLVYQRDGTPVGALTPPTEAGAINFGVALSGSRLYAQWYDHGPDGDRYVTSVHALDQPGMPALAQEVTNDGCCGYPETAVAPAARGDLVALQPFRRVLRADGAGTLTPLTGVGHGSLRAPVRREGEEIVVLGPYSVTRVDVTDPDAPALTSGGMSLPTSAAAFRLAITSPGAGPELVEPRPTAFQPLEQTRDDELFALLDATTTPPTELGSGFVRGDSMFTPFAFEDGALYQAMSVGDLTVRLRRYQSARLAGLHGAEWRHDVEHTVNITAAPTIARSHPQALFVAPSGDLLLVNVLSTGGTPSVLSFRLLWITLTEDAATVVASGTFATSELPWAIDAAFVGDSAFLLGNDRVARISRQGDAIVRDHGRGLPGIGLYQRIVLANDTHVMVTRHDWSSAEEPRDHLWAVDVIARDTLDVAFSYDTPDEVLTAFVTGTRIVFGMNSALALATPMCAP